MLTVRCQIASSLFAEVLPERLASVGGEGEQTTHAIGIADSDNTGGFDRLSEIARSRLGSHRRVPGGAAAAVMEKTRVTAAKAGKILQRASDGARVIADLERISGDAKQFV